MKAIGRHHHGAGHGPQGLRRRRPAAVGALEARLLAGQTDAMIAERCGLTAEAVTWYESIFFNIRGRLKAWGYIRTTSSAPG